MLEIVSSAQDYVHQGGQLGALTWYIFPRNQSDFEKISKIDKNKNTSFLKAILRTILNENENFGIPQKFTNFLINLRIPRFPGCI